MNKFKTILMAIIILSVVGCTNKIDNLNKTYENMIVGKTGINGYTLNLRMQGTLNENKVNENVIVRNYNNEDYEITKTGNLPNEESVNYIIDGIKYTKDNSGEYIETSNTINYANPSAYIEGLKHVKKVNKTTEEKIGDKTYTLYNVEVDESILKGISNDCGLSFSSNADIKTDIWIDSDSYVYKIIYYIGDVKINANYYAIDNSKTIRIRRDINKDL
jgi:hypothetical protein